MKMYKVTISALFLSSIFVFSFGQSSVENREQKLETIILKRDPKKGSEQNILQIQKKKKKKRLVDSQAIKLRAGTQGKFNKIVLANFGTGLDFETEKTQNWFISGSYLTHIRFENITTP